MDEIILYQSAILVVVSLQIKFLKKFRTHRQKESEKMTKFPTFFAIFITALVCIKSSLGLQCYNYLIETKGFSKVNETSSELVECPSTAKCCVSYDYFTWKGDRELKYYCHRNDGGPGPYMTTARSGQIWKKLKFCDHFQRADSPRWDHL